MKPEPLADRIIRRYREGDYIHAGQPWPRRHPAVTAVAVLFGISTVLAYWYIMIPAVIVVGLGTIFVCRYRYARDTLARLEANADAELEELRRLGREDVHRWGQTGDER